MPDIIITPSSGIIDFFPVSARVGRIEGSGNTINIVNPSGFVAVSGSGLSINTSSPNATFHAYSAVSGATLLNLEGTNGSLFSVIDNLSGTLMSVNNNAGLPVFEVFSDDRVVAGRFGQNDFIMTSGGNVGIGTGVPSSKFHVVGTSTFNGDVSSTGSFIGGSGTAALPSFEFINDVDTGLFSAAANTFGISTSGVERLRVDSIGNIGIGTTSPQVLLHVNGQAYLQSLNLTGGTADRILATDTNKNVVGLNTSTYPTLTELSYVKGATSSIQTQLDTKAPLSSPTFSGIPAVPTASSGTNTTQIASTAFVRTEISNLVSSAPATLDTLNELATALGNDANFSTTVTTNLGGKANLSGATFTGSVSGPSGNFTSLKVNSVDVSAVGHTHTSSNITDFNSSVSGLLPTIANSGDNRVLTSTGGSVGVNAESNLTFNGNLLSVTGSGIFSSGIIASNISVTGNMISATNSNGNLIIKPNGDGALQADNTGNSRGTLSVDLQRSRASVSGVAYGDYSVIGGGTNNRSAGVASTIGGGSSNNSGGQFSTVGGGIGNSAGGYRGTIGGGASNSNGAYYSDSTIGGGYNNSTAGRFTTVGGGYNNSAGGGYYGASTVGGGRNNSASHSYSTIGGGRNNVAGGYYSTVGGGYTNSASNGASTIGGGTSNIASGYRSTIGGGNNNSATGDRSTVPGGLQAKATRYGETSHSAGRFGNDGDAQHTILIARNSTVNASGTVLFLDGSSSRLTIPAETTWIFTTKLSAYNDTDNLRAGYNIRGCIGRNAASGTSIIGSNIVESWVEGAMSGCVATATADDTNEALQINVNGLASKNIRWVAVVDISQVSYAAP